MSKVIPVQPYARPVTVIEGLAWLEDGTTVDLLKIQASLNYAFKETGKDEFNEAMTELSKMTGKIQGPNGDFLDN